MGLSWSGLQYQVKESVQLYAGIKKKLQMCSDERGLNLSSHNKDESMTTDGYTHVF